MTKREWRIAVLDTLLALTAIVILALTIPPTGRNHQTIVHLIPFQEILPVLLNDSPPSPPAVTVGNVLLFLPLGVLIPMRLPKLDKLVAITALCVGISTTIELVQLPIGHHSTSTDDVLLNTLGGVLGYVAMRGVRSLLRRRLPQRGTKSTRRRG